MPSCAVALMVILLATNLSGVGITYDSTEYLAGAKSLIEGGTFAAIDGRPQATWPPGYSLLLSLPMRTGLSPIASSLIITALSLFVVAFSLLALLVRSGLSTRGSIIGATVLMLSPGLVNASALALSEIPFIAFLLASWWVLRFRNTVPPTILGAILLGFASLIRYAGLFFIPWIVLVVILCQRGHLSWRKNLLNGAMTLVISSAIPYLWTQRNLREVGTTTGNREPGGGTFFAALRQAVDSLGQLTTGAHDWVPASLPLVAGSALALSLVLAIALNVRLRRFDLALLATTPIGYLVFSAYRFVHIEYAPIDLRALTPIAPFVLVALAATRWRMIRLRPLRRLMPLLALPLVLIGIVHVGSAAGEADAWGSPRFQESAFANVVDTLPRDSVFISNFPQRAFSLTESIPIRNQYQFDLPAVTDCTHRYGLWFAEAPFQGNEPVLATVMYRDEEGTIYDLGNCAKPPKSYWE